MKLRMTQKLGTLGVLALLGTSATDLGAQAFSCGSSEADGSIVVTDGTTTLDLPPDGRFHATTIQVAAGATLRFNPNALNTPAFLLAAGDVAIEGTVEVNGSSGSDNPPLGGRGGPGGFGGGAPGIAELPAGAGRGPGGGLGGNNSCCDGNTAGAGAYGGRNGQGAVTRNGRRYGSPVLIPLLGGSGGGGTNDTPERPGGGGGGALMICSDTRLSVTGRVEAVGGRGFSLFNTPNGGSGGAVRLVAPIVAGNGTVDVQGGCDVSLNCGGVQAGHGRIRIDAIDRSQLNIVAAPSQARSVGSTMLAFLDPEPRLDLLEVAGQILLEATEDPVSILLPVGSPVTQIVRVQGTGFAGLVSINVVLTPENGDPVVVPAEIDMDGSSSAEVAVQVDFPVNVVTRVNAWTR